MRRYLALAGLLVALGAPTILPSPEACARRLGIPYSVEQGATEELDSFHRCITKGY